MIGLSNCPDDIIGELTVYLDDQTTLSFSKTCLRHEEFVIKKLTKITDVQRKRFPKHNDEIRMDLDILFIFYVNRKSALFMRALEIYSNQNVAFLFADERYNSSEFIELKLVLILEAIFYVLPWDEPNTFPCDYESKVFDLIQKEIFYETNDKYYINQLFRILRLLKFKFRLVEMFRFSITCVSDYMLEHGDIILSYLYKMLNKVETKYRSYSYYDGNYYIDTYMMLYHAVMNSDFTDFDPEDLDDSNFF